MQKDRLQEIYFILICGMRVRGETLRHKPQVSAKS